MTEETADAVVVGAGHNGLVAANLLAGAGWDVVVLEAAAVPGGAVRSAEVAAPGYLSDLCSAFYPLGYASPVLNELGLDGYGLSWANAPDVLAHLFPDGRAAVLNRDPERTAASLASFDPRDGDAWLKLYESWLPVGEPLIAALLRPFPPVRPALRLLRPRTLPLGDALRLGRRFLVPARALGDELFDGEGAKALLSGLGLHTDLGPDASGSGVYGWLLSMIGQRYGFPVPVGGAQRITNALVARLLALGGELRCGVSAERVVVARGKALGVRCSDGYAVRARRAVLCDVPATTLFERLVGPAATPSRTLSDLRGFGWDHGTVKIDWALSAPVPWRAPAVRGAGTVHLGADLAGMRRYAGALAAGDPPAEPFVIAGQMSVADPSRSPEGTESLWAYTRVPWRRALSAAEIDERVALVESLFERHAPGFRDLVVGRRVAGPDALEAENPSLCGGAINGGSAAPYQQVIFRPLPGIGRADTPIDRLYLASASAHPGGGVHGAPGANAARAALARGRPITGDLYGATIRSLFRWIEDGPAR